MRAKLDYCIIKWKTCCS